MYLHLNVSDLLPRESMQGCGQSQAIVRYGGCRAVLTVRLLSGKRGGTRCLSAFNTTRCHGCGSWERALRAQVGPGELRFLCSRCQPFEYESRKYGNPERDRLVTAILGGDVEVLRAHRQRMLRLRSRRAARLWLEAVRKVERGEWKLTRQRRRAIERAKMTQEGRRKDAS